MAIADALYGDPSQIGPPSPSNDPVVLEQNKSKWRNFLAKVNDPNVQQAIMTTGINMLRSPGYGQNSGDVIANALSQGVNTLSGLRQLDYEHKTQAQQRVDKQQQEAIQNRQGDQRIANDVRSTDAYGRQVDNQADATRRTDTRENRRLDEDTRHNLADEDIARQRAKAENTRANAYKNSGNRVPAEIQKINNLTAQYLAEGMDEVSAKARATLVIDSTGTAKSPGEQARALYEAKLKNWSGDINNFGKSMTREQAQQMLDESINDVHSLQQFNSQATALPGTTPQGTATPPARPGQPRAAAKGESPVGTTKSGYKKVKKGPDADKSTWQKVNGSGK